MLEVGRKFSDNFSLKIRRKILEQGGGIARVENISDNLFIKLRRDSHIDFSELFQNILRRDCDIDFSEI